MYAEDPNFLAPRLHDGFDLAYTPKMGGRSLWDLPPGPGIFAFRNPVERQLAFIDFLQREGALDAYDTIMGLGIGVVGDALSSAGRAIGRGVKSAGRAVGGALKAGYDATVGKAVEWAAEGVNWVVEQVKDLDKWMYRQLDKIGLGGAYRKIADTVVKIGKDALVMVGEAVDGAIDLLIVKGGAYLGALAAGVACSGALAFGVPLEPTTCAAIGAQVGELAGKAVGDLKEHIKEQTKRAFSPRDVPQGIQQMQRGLTMQQCPLPDPTDIVLLFDEPLERWTPQQKYNYFSQKARESSHPKAKAYFNCRMRQYNFGSLLSRLGVPSISAASAAISRMNPLMARANFAKSIGNLNKLGLRHMTHTGFQSAGGGAVKLSTHASSAKKDDDNTWVWIASGVAVVGLAVVAKKKGVF